MRTVPQAPEGARVSELTGGGRGGRCRCMEDEQADGWDGAGKLGMGEMS